MRIELTRVEEFALIRLNRPDALNALSFALIRDLGRALDEVPASEARALEMIMTGCTVDAEEAHRIGLVNRLIDGDAVAQGVAFAREFSGHSLPVLGFAREAVKRALDNPVNEGLGIEADLSTRAFQTADAVEGMDAFIAKRKPHFTDK